MTDPATSTTHTIAYVGILALLMSWFDQDTAQVLMVVFSSLAGCFLVLRDMSLRGKRLSILKSIKFVIVGVMLSLVVAWPFAALLEHALPVFSGPYSTSLVALVMGYNNQKIPQLLIAIFEKLVIK